MVGTFINLVLSMVGIANLEEAAAEMIPVFLDALVLVMRKGFSRRSSTLPAQAAALGLKSTWIGKWLSAAIAVPLCQ